MLAIPTETEELVRRVAVKTGKTPEEVVRDAVVATAREMGVTPDRRARSRDELIAGMKAISDRCAALPVYDTRTPDQLVCLWR
jgi:hypothetical protein